MAKTRKVNAATVHLWNNQVGAIAWDENRKVGFFQYTPEFVQKGLEVAPLIMPLDEKRIYSFPTLNRETYYGLPGLLADTLPDRYGNTLINLWLSKQGRTVQDFSPVERLCYLGTRGMGALEFKPSIGPRAYKTIPIKIPELTQLAEDILKQKNDLSVNLSKEKEKALKTIIRVGTSAGGARAKAVISWNPETNEVRSGQVLAPEGFKSWILKFDGINDDMLGDPGGFGRIEYAYYKMSIDSGIQMTPCRLMEENSRAHFMTQRFDRTKTAKKLHLQSLCAMGHLDFNAPGENSYEQAFGIIQKLNLGHPAAQELFRRMVFNVLARNQDDHTRNISFLMDDQGKWSLAPAYDMIWSYRPDSRWVNKHQMRINGKQDEFTIDDLLFVADQYGIMHPKDIFSRIHQAVSNWPEYAKQTEVKTEVINEIGKTHRVGSIKLKK